MILTLALLSLVTVFKTPHLYMCISNIKSSMLWTIFKKVFEFWRERNYEFGVGDLPVLKFEVRGVKSDLEDIWIRMCFFSRPPSGNCETENVRLYSETSLAILLMRSMWSVSWKKKWLLKVFKGRIIQHLKTAQKELYLRNKLYQF